jgi:hypothetical protein
MVQDYLSCAAIFSIPAWATSFVSARVVCAANADRTDGFVANLNRHAAANSYYPGNLS